MKRLVLLLSTLFSAFVFAQTGEIDSTFGINGKVTTSFGSNSNMARCVAFQPDGKFIVAGYYISSRGDLDFALARYTASGVLDASFGLGGRVATDFLEINNTSNVALSIVVLANGKILVMGATTQLIVPDTALVRYNSDGSLDTSFGTNGKVISHVVPSDISGYGGAMAVQPDGKIIIAGIDLYAFNPNYYTAIERYDENGILDTTFGTNGKVLASYGNGKSYASSIALQTDGKIVVCGTYMQTGNFVMAAMRFTANGALDTSFSGDGKVVTTFGSGTYGQARSISVNEAGKIIVAGLVSSAGQNFGIVQYNANGSLDTSFDTDGKAFTPIDPTNDYANFNSISRLPDGKFLTSCRLSNLMLAASDFVLRKYNADSTSDTAFGTNGEVRTTFDAGLNEALFASVMPNGKIVAVGKSVPSVNDHTEFAVARYSASGVLDTSLDSDGKLTTRFEKGNDRMKKMLLLPNDKIIAIGISDYRNANNSTARDIILAKYNANGSLDTGFGNSGKVYAVFGQQLNTVTAAALQPDGKIVVGNMYYNFGDASYSYELIRFTANGAVDTPFGTNGKLPTTFSAESIAFQTNGKMVVGGSGDIAGAGFSYAIARYNANGTADLSFDNDGFLAVSLGQYNMGNATLLLQPDNKILLSGSASSESEDGGLLKYVTARFEANGAPDSAFGTNGMVKTLLLNGGVAKAAFLKSDGKIVIAGTAFASGGYNFASVRYNSNGTLDTTYAANGIATGFLSNDYREINAISLQPDGKFLVALTLYNQLPNFYDFKVRRFNQDGTSDYAFGASSGVSVSFYDGYDEAFGVAVQAGSKVVVGGTTHNGMNYDFALTRLQNEILGVEDFSPDAAKVILYPNPVKDMLHIEFPEGVEIIGCTVYSILGQLVYKNSNPECEIDTRSWSSGLYSISICTNKGIVNRKFLK